MTTTQTQTQPSAPKTHGAIAQAPTPVKTADTKAAIKTDTKTENKAEAKTDDAEAKRTARKVYIVTGDIREFKNAAEAEKFLNADPSAPKEFTVIKGLKVEKKQKVSLR